MLSPRFNKHFIIGLQKFFSEQLQQLYIIKKKDETGFVSVDKADSF
jgi:hypothetical protein